MAVTRKKGKMPEKGVRKDYGKDCGKNVKQKYGIYDAYKNIKKYPMVILVVDVAMLHLPWLVYL